MPTCVRNNAMNTITLIDPATATGSVKVLLDGIRKKRGTVPGLMRVLAHSPAALRGYLELRSALAGATLSPQLLERIAIAVAAYNNCRSCLAAHIHFGRAAGLEQSELDAARHAMSADPAAAAALRFARELQHTAGHVPQSEVEAMRQAGFDDAGMVDIATAVALNVLTNMVNNLAGVEPEFSDTPGQPESSRVLLDRNLLR